MSLSLQPTTLLEKGEPDLTFRDHTLPTLPYFLGPYHVRLKGPFVLRNPPLTMMSLSMRMLVMMMMLMLTMMTMMTMVVVMAMMMMMMMMMMMDCDDDDDDDDDDADE